MNSMRNGCLSLLCAMALASAASADDLDLDRNWTIEGKPCRGTLVAADDRSITLKLANGPEKEVPVADVSRDDKEFIKAVRICDESGRVYSDINPRIAKFALEPLAQAKATAAFLDAFQRETKPDQPKPEPKLDFAADFYGGVINAFAGNLRDADRQLGKAMNRIQRVGQVSAESHRTTLASALNNQAVVAIRQGKPQDGVKLLCTAAELLVVPPHAVIHNANYLLAGKKLVPALSQADQKKLAKVIAKQAANPPQMSRERLYYSLVHDSLQPLLGVNPVGGDVPPLEVLPDLLCHDCTGTGKRDCRNCVNGAINAVRMRAAVVNPLHGEVLIRDHFKARCEACQGAGNFPCPNSDCVHGKVPEFPPARNR